MAIKIGDVQLTDSLAPISSRSSSTVVSPGHGNLVVGFDEHLSKIKDMLCGRRDILQVIQIVGMAGIGKTTLARMAYNDPLIEQVFDVRAWVTVSHDYNIQNILQNLLHSMKEFEAKGSEQSIQKMRERLYQNLKGRRYIIVLDDIWSTNVWDVLLKFSIPDDDDGSRIMCTSRLLHLNIPYNSRQYEMRLMNVDESWNLLRKKVLRDQHYDDEIAKIGREIARKCGGLPLAIELIAGVLSTVSKTSASWEKIAENVNSTLYESKDGQFEKIISLYTHLPHHLRSCFLYMGSFPEGYEINVSKLIKLWIAEGFLTPSPTIAPLLEDGLGILEDKQAELYLKDFVDRSLAIVERRKSNGRIKSCSIHVLVREFCKRRAQEENFQHRRSIACSDLKCLAKTYGSTIRTVTCFEPNETSLDAVRKLRLLRVLDVVDADSNVYSLPAQVFELFHLRYLAFGCPMKIPPAISMLQNLQTLIIHPRKVKGSQNYSMDDEVYLPLEIWMIPQLRHLVSFFDILPDPKQTAFALENLQTLSVVKKFLCNQKLLERIPRLKKLGITFFGDKYAESCQLNNLVYLRQLKKLKLLWNRDSLFVIKVNPVYPETLKKLTLSGWRLPWNHMEAVGSLPNLQVLKLRHYACQGDKWETIEGQFRRLEYLLIDESDIQHWITGDRHFQRLRSLVIHHCPLLSEIPISIAKSHWLQLIEIENGNESLVKSAKQIQEKFKRLGLITLKFDCP